MLHLVFEIFYGDTVNGERIIEIINPVIIQDGKGIAR